MNNLPIMFKTIIFYLGWKLGQLANYDTNALSFKVKIVLSFF